MPEPIQIQLEYFALLKDLTGKTAESRAVNSGSLRQLYAEIKNLYAIPLTEHQMRAAVNDRFASWDTPLQNGDKVVFIPPVSGG